ncbi:MAG: hypothetical protein HYR56_10170 [Acidobacteria bacterium]|nr:hypothetical protein [Acidobacteriota bacterium]MBI3423140.1 hypothetical protein [Acidobacteriota bacterium]
MQYKTRLTLSAAGLLLTMILFNTVPAAAQSLIFNTPSTDVVAKGKTYVEMDWFGHLESLDNGGYHGFYPRVVVGVGKGVEVGANVAWSKSVTPNQPVQVIPNVKWQVYSNEKTGVTSTVGVLAYLTVKNRQNGGDNYALLYSNVSKKFKSDFGPRFTGGYYHLVGRAAGTGTTKGAMLGYEQPLHPKVSFVMDWYSGKNSLGYLTPALVFSLPKSQSISAGWLIGNQGRKNNYLYLTYGFTF